VNHSIYGADRATHLKILFAALVMASVVLKAGRSIAVTSSNVVVAR
jgi:hypothetical protein